MSPCFFQHIEFLWHIAPYMSKWEKDCSRENSPDRSPSYILRPFAQSANQNSLERSHTLLLLLSQILVNYTYKFFYRNSVNHASLFQRLHLRRRASDAVHSSAH